MSSLSSIPTKLNTSLDLSLGTVLNIFFMVATPHDKQPIAKPLMTRAQHPSKHYPGTPNPLEDIEPMLLYPKQAPPVTFWLDGQEPPFTGKKVTKYIFVTNGKGKSKPSKKITRNTSEINCLRNAPHLKQIFHPRTDSKSDLDNKHFQIMEDVYISSGQAATSTLIFGSRTTLVWNDDDKIEVYDGLLDMKQRTDVPNPDFERSMWFTLIAKDQVSDPKGLGFPVIQPATKMEVLLLCQDEMK
ncbi:hypothetical protein F4604DRAFT_1677036 [Suillus subluteus]|nr:hypothetical protein F4604DRAFT_1677036 [Suillus subluteus]